MRLLVSVPAVGFATLPVDNLVDSRVERNDDAELLGEAS